MIEEVAALADLLRDRATLVLTGAGCSTESGIPDYRGPTAVPRDRGPITYQEFVKDPAGRRRYWARAVRGWPRIRDAQPNDGHYALAGLEMDERITGVVTQNVDRLHHKAGSERVVELHGALAEVVCLDCGAQESRGSLHARLLALNRLDPAVGVGDPLLPDGDAAVRSEVVASFQVAGCQACAGVLKPRVVFFGENVPRPVHDASTRMLEEAEALLIVGSSLAVYSGYRFLRRAAQRGIPTALLNLGPPQRGLDKIDLHIDAPAGAVLTALASNAVR